MAFQGTVLVVSLAALVSIASAAIFKMTDTTASNEVEVRVSSGRLKRSPTLEPDQRFDMMVDIDGVEVKKSLNLIATHRDVDMFVIDRGAVKPAEQYPIKRNWAVYGSDDGDAAMLVKHHPEHGVRLEGSLNHKDEQYFIQPGHNTKRHVLHTIHPDAHAHGRIDTLSDEVEKKIRNKVKRATGEVYEIEEMFVFDQQLYASFERIKRTGENSLEMMKEYYGLLINEMNYRYQSLKRNYNLDLRVVMGGLVIDRDGSLKPYRAPKLNSGNEVDANSVLKQLERWKRENFLSLDNVQMHVGFNFSAVFIGLANYDGLCNNYSVGIVEDNMSYRTSLTSTHELGHNADMQHDRSGTSCGRNYIMFDTALRLIQNAKWPHNTYKFSQCSYNNVRDYIRTLKKENRNCLAARTAKHDMVKYADKDLFPGANLTYDEQCNRAMVGTKFCSLDQYKYDTEKICYAIFCHYPNSRNRKCYERYSFPGTPCGNYRVCKRGKCVEDKKLGKPSASNCPFGDQSGEAISYNRGHTMRTCADTAGQSASYCYQTHIQKICCGTCNKLWRKTPNGRCQYGESGVNIQIKGKSYYKCADAIKVLPGICYKQETACCESCPKQRTTDGRCRYGDSLVYQGMGIRVAGKKYLLCSEAVKDYPSACYKYQVAKDCCGSCKAAADDSNPKCKYGDYSGKVVRAQGGVMQSCADTIQPGRSWACYQGDGAQKCCASCKKYETSDRSCKFGDKLVRINNKYQVCSDVIKSQDDAWLCHRNDHYCCVTCKKFETKVPRCRYGDSGEKVSQLGGRTCKEALTQDTSGYCYEYNVKNKCCGSCHKFLNKDLGPYCKYGDKRGKMRGKDVDCAAEGDKKTCKDYYFKRHCCGTCAKINKS